MNRPSKTKLALAIVFGGAIFGLFSYITVDEVIHHTSDVEFCGSCHSMGPIAKSYAKDVHGGANKYGTVAQCVDCHLPHDSSINYLFVKTKLGIHDVWTEFVVGPEDVPWVEKRKRVTEFTYDSGCMKCHAKLERATMGSNKAFVAHKPYFQKETPKTCTSCHEHVGHEQLGAYLHSAGVAKINNGPKGE